MIVRDATPILYLDDVETLLPILEDALGAQEIYRWPAGDERPAYVVIRAGKGQLGLARRGEIMRLVPGLGAVMMSRRGGTAPLEWAVAVDDVEEGCVRLVAAGGRLIEPPALRPWGETSAWVLLPASLLVHLYRSAKGDAP